jgi:hypothetical protein
VVSFKPQPLYPRVNNIKYPMDGPQKRSGRFGKEKNPLTLPGIDPCTVQNIVTIVPELHHVCNRIDVVLFQIHHSSLIMEVVLSVRVEPYYQISGAITRALVSDIMCHQACFNIRCHYACFSIRYQVPSGVL